MELDGVDNGGLVTIERHLRSSIRLVYHVHSVKTLISPTSQKLAGIFRLENISACCHRVGTSFVVRILVGFSDGPILNGSHYKVAC
jgi:hypothetical protein